MCYCDPEWEGFNNLYTTIDNPNEEQRSAWVSYYAEWHDANLLALIASLPAITWWHDWPDLS